MRRARERVAQLLAPSGLHVVDVPRVTDAAVPSAVIVPRRLDYADELGGACAPMATLDVVILSGADEDEPALEAALDAALAALAAPAGGVLVDSAERDTSGGDRAAYVITCRTHDR